MTNYYEIFSFFRWIIDKFHIEDKIQNDLTDTLKREVNLKWMQFYHYFVCRVHFFVHWLPSPDQRPCPSFSLFPSVMNGEESCNLKFIRFMCFQMFRFIPKFVRL